MQAIILAAGEGIRMRPLTLETPKPLLNVTGRPIIEHIITAFPADVTELIVVIGYRGEQIQTFLGDAFRGRTVTYVWQKKPEGTARAIQLCRPYLTSGRFFVTYADDLHDPESIRAMLAYERSLLVLEHDYPERFGVATLNPDNTIAEIIEKPEHPQSRLVLTGMMLLDRHVFEYEPDQHRNGEYYLTTMLAKMLLTYPIMAVRTRWWLPIATPQDLAAAETFLERLKREPLTA